MQLYKRRKEEINGIWHKEENKRKENRRRQKKKEVQQDHKECSWYQIGIFHVYFFNSWGWHGSNPVRRTC